MVLITPMILRAWRRTAALEVFLDTHPGAQQGVAMPLGPIDMGNGVVASVCGFRIVAKDLLGVRCSRHGVPDEDSLQDFQTAPVFP